MRSRAPTISAYASSTTRSSLSANARYSPVRVADALVARGTEAGVRLVHHAHAGVVGGDPVGELAGRVGRAVVDDDDLERRVRLAEDAGAGSRRGSPPRRTPAPPRSATRRTSRRRPAADGAELTSPLRRRPSGCAAGVRAPAGTMAPQPRRHASAPSGRRGRVRRYGPGDLPRRPARGAGGARRAPRGDHGRAGDHLGLEVVARRTRRAAGRAPRAPRAPAGPSPASRSSASHVRRAIDSSRSGRSRSSQSRSTRRRPGSTKPADLGPDVVGRRCQGPGRGHGRIASIDAAPSRSGGRGSGRTCAAAPRVARSVFSIMFTHAATPCPSCSRSL